MKAQNKNLIRKYLTNLFVGFGVLSFFMLVCGLSVYLFLGDLNFFTYEEGGRLLSPDGRYEAVIVIREQGGFGSPLNLLYIALKGEKFKSGEGNFKFEVFNGYGYDIKYLEWVGPRDLRINYKNKRINRFEPQWINSKDINSRKPEEEWERVNIHLRVLDHVENG